MGNLHLETKTLNEEKTLNQLVTAPLQKHCVGGSAAYPYLLYRLSN